MNCVHKKYITLFVYTLYVKTDARHTQQEAGSHMEPASCDIQGSLLFLLLGCDLANLGELHIEDKGGVRLDGLIALLAVSEN